MFAAECVGGGVPQAKVEGASVGIEESAAIGCAGDSYLLVVEKVGVRRVGIASLANQPPHHQSSAGKKRAGQVVSRACLATSSVSRYRAIKSVRVRGFVCSSTLDLQGKGQMRNAKRQSFLCLRLGALAP